MRRQVSAGILLKTTLMIIVCVRALCVRGRRFSGEQPAGNPELLLGSLISELCALRVVCVNAECARVEDVSFC